MSDSGVMSTEDATYIKATPFIEGDLPAPHPRGIMVQI